MVYSLKSVLVQGEEIIANVTTICRKGGKNVPGNHKPVSLSFIGADKNIISQDVQKGDTAFAEGNYVAQK